MNGDLSTYLSRGMTKGKNIPQILSRMEHTHQRMCRKYGDLSVNVGDVQTDWDTAGVTWQAFQFSMTGLQGGLSSRCIVGESGACYGAPSGLPWGGWWGDD